MAGNESQRQTSPSTRRDEDDATPDTPDTPASAQVRDQAREQQQGVDDLLDEIDTVLESNAEEFVHGFVQKGGQ